MADDPVLPTLTDCNCRSLRQAARYVTQVYDRHLAPSGLRISQFGVLAVLKRKGPLTINELAAELVIDRTTLGRNILPLERDGLIAVKPSTIDRRRKELQLTRLGDKRWHDARQYWLEAQADFERAFGNRRSADLRHLLRSLVSRDLGPIEEEAPLA